MQLTKIMKAIIHVTLKNGVLDPQGSAIKQTLNQKGFDDINNVKQGKFFELSLDTQDKTKANKLLDDICSNLLANLVIENYKYEIIE